MFVPKRESVSRSAPHLAANSDASDAESYLTLELCHGTTLDQAGRFESVRSALNVLSAIAINLEYLSASGIVHGDLKPQNIFLPAGWSDGHNYDHYYLKLSDFSLGRSTGESSKDRAGLGTIGYMPPETILNSSINAPSDLFALGVTAYQLLSGQHPFLSASTDPVQVKSGRKQQLGFQTCRSDLLASKIVCRPLQNFEDRPALSQANSLCNQLSGPAISSAWAWVVKVSMTSSRSPCMMASSL